MNVPTSLTPEVAAWLRVQMTIAAARAIEPLQVRLQMLDDFADGMYEALVNVVPDLLRAQPELARKIAPLWQHAAERSEDLEDEGAPQELGETLEYLEARAMLYRFCKDAGVWPVPSRGRGVVKVVRSERRA